MSENFNTNLKLEASYRQIFKLFLPIALSLFIPQINFFINTFFISKLDNVYLASHTIASVYYLIFAVVGIGLNNGVQMLMSYYAGKNKHLLFIEYFNNGNSLGILIAVLGVFFTYFFLEPLLSNFIQNRQIFLIVISYLKIRIWGLPLLYLYLARNALFINLNQTHWLIYTSIIESGLNIFFDYVLIFGNMHFSELHIYGAAWASIIAEAFGYIGCVCIIKFYVQKKINFSYAFKFDLQIIKEILVKSSPLILQLLFAVVSWEVFFIMIENLGQKELAISGVVRTLLGFFSILTWSLGQITNTVVSNLLGQNNKSSVIKALKKILIISFTTACIIGLLSWHFNTSIIHVFIQDDTLIQQCIGPFNMTILSLIIMSIGSIFLNFIIGTGKTKNNLLIEIFSAGCYLFYIYIVIQKNKSSLTWAWFSEIVYWFITLGLSFLYFLKWKKNEVS